MKTLIIKVDPAAYDPGAAQEVIEIVRKGGIVVFPTETFYGLGADATSPEAVGKVMVLKGRDRGKPLSVVVPDVAAAELLIAAGAAVKVFRSLTARFWPGPLTLVLRVNPRCFLPASGQKQEKSPPTPFTKGGRGGIFPRLADSRPKFSARGGRSPSEFPDTLGCGDF